MTVTLSPLHIDCEFDAGNIHVVDASNPAQVHLHIRPDTHSGHFQWFHFKVSGLIVGQTHRFSLDNAHASSYKNAWTGYNAAASYDQKTWFRVPSQYDGKALSFEVEAEHDTIWFAYFEPYSRARHNQLIERARQIPGVEVLANGRSVQGRDIRCCGQAMAVPASASCGSSPSSTPANIWPNGSSKGLSTVCRPTTRPLRNCWPRPTST